MSHIMSDIEVGGRKVLDIHARNEAIQLTWVQAYLRVGPDRPTWAILADEILANDVPGEPRTLLDDLNARINQFLQTWSSRKHRKRGGDPEEQPIQPIPEDLREMLRVARKYGVRLEAIHPVRESKEELPAARSSQTKALERLETLCDKYGKCLRNSHGIRTMADVAKIAEDIPRQHK